MAWDFVDGIAIYSQIIDHIKLKIAVGEYKPGDRLPPVRELAALAEVNPNTMQKSLAELERQGFLHAERTAGRYITDNKELIGGLKSLLVERNVDKYFTSMATLGYCEKEAARIAGDYAGRGMRS